MSYTDVIYVLEACGLGPSTLATPGASAGDIRNRALQTCDRVWYRLQREQHRNTNSDAGAPYITDEEAFVFVLTDSGAVVATENRSKLTNLIASERILVESATPFESAYPSVLVEVEPNTNTLRPKKRNINAFVKGYVLRGSDSSGQNRQPDPIQMSTRLPDTKPPMSPSVNSTGLQQKSSLLAQDDLRVVRTIAPRRQPSPPSTVETDDTWHSSSVLSSLSQESHEEHTQPSPRRPPPSVRKSTSNAILQINPSSPRRPRDSIGEGTCGSLAAVLAAKRLRKQAMAKRDVLPNRHSRTAVHESAHRRQSLSEAAELTACTFKPFITSRSRLLGGDSHSRLMRSTVSKVAKSTSAVRRSLELQEQKELEGCTFAPNINPYQNFHVPSRSASADGNHFSGFGKTRPVLMPSSHVPPLYVEFVARLRAGVAVRMDRPTKFSDTGYLRRSCSAPPMIFGLNYKSNIANTIESLTGPLISPSHSRSTSPQGVKMLTSGVAKDALSHAERSRRHYEATMNNMSVEALATKSILRLPTKDGDVYDVVFAPKPGGAP